MKKISLYFTLAFACLFLASCNEDFEDWADPQSYLPEDAITIPGLAATSTGAIDLGNIEADSVQLFNLAQATLPEGFELGNARIILVPDMEGATPSILIADLLGRVSKEDLQGVLVDLFGVRPDQRALKGTVMLDAVKDGQAVLINAGTIDLLITPEAPVIEDVYYLVGDVNGWSDSDTSFPMMNGGGDVYEDPVFSIIIDNTGGDMYFKVAPASAIGDGDFWNKIICAVTEEDDDAMEGRFALGNNGKAFLIRANSAFAQYKIAFNMLDYTYTITGIAGGGDIWYLVGSCIGDGSWNNSTGGLGTALIPLIPSEGDATILEYVGYLNNDGFKLIHTPGDWGEQWGMSDGVLVKNDGGSGNITLPGEPGYYKITYDQSADNVTIAPYSATPSTFSTITMPGSYQGWNAGGNPMTAISSKVENHDWFAEITYDEDAPSDGGMKFANGSWDINWGATGWPYGYGTQGGPNIPFMAGTYKIFFNDITGAYIFIK